MKWFKATIYGVTEHEIFAEAGNYIYLPNGTKEIKSCEYQWWRKTRDEAKQCVICHHLREINRIENNW